MSTGRLLVPVAIFAALAAGLAALLLLEGAALDPAPRPPPPPTEHWLGPDAESLNKTRRKAFYEHIHRAAPSVEWRQIERRNGLAQVAKRNALPPPDDEGGHWVERGSDNQAGRVHVARHTADGDTLFVGSALGGLWMGPPDGSDWEPIGDNLYGGAHWLEVFEDPGGGDPTLLAATDGGLVHWSDDLGDTWHQSSGMPPIYRVRRVTRPRDDSAVAWGVVEGWDGVWAVRSTDAGRTFSVAVELGGFQGDLWVPRDGDDTVFLAESGWLTVSEDGGETWARRGALAPGASHVELVGSEAGAPTLYAVVDGRSLHRSDDAGVSWSVVREISDYWGTLQASQLDAGLFAYGGMELWVSRDAGASFSRPNTWDQYYGDPARLLHADVMGIDAEPTADGGEAWYANTDGGLYVSTDGLATFDNLALKGLRISQYYDVHTSAANPEHVAAGAQDQGYQVTQGVEQDDDQWELDQILSGDYGHLTSGDGTHALVYSVYPGFTLVQIGEDEPELAYVEWPPVSNRSIWMPSILADPDDPEVFYFPAEQLYRFDRTSRWTWEPSLHSDHRFDLDEGEYVSALAFAPSDTDRMVAATSAGRVWRSDDHGETWTQGASVVAGEHWLYGHALLVSADDPDVLTVGGSGYSNAPVFRSEDGGDSWVAWDEGMPSTHVYMLAEARDGSGRVAAATQNAAYVRQPGVGDWVDITGAEAPVTLYWSVEAVPEDDVFRFGTYGRGIWDYHLPPPAEVEDTGAAGGDDGAGDGAPDDAGADGEDGNTGVVPPPSTESPAGCGCSAGPSPGRLALGAALLACLSAGRRRMQ